MEKAIKKAIEGGWEGLEFKDSIKIDDFRPVDIHSRVWGESELGEVHITTVAQVVCHPLFWQALGKSLGWDDKTCYHFPSGPFRHQVCMQGMNQTAYNWHRFIDHIALGKPADNFFNELLS